jgi:hypothetical protein
MTGRIALVAILSALACGGGFNPTDPIGRSGTLSEGDIYVAVADNSALTRTGFRAGDERESGIPLSVASQRVPLPRQHTKCPPDTVRCGHSCCDFDSICVNGGCCVPPHCPLATR